MGIYDGAGNFVNEIKSTREYTELIQSKNNIEKNPSLRREVNDYNKKLSEIYSSNKSISEIESKVSDLNRQFGGLFKVPEVDRLTKATKAFNEMMFKVYKSINDSIETGLKLK